MGRSDRNAEFHENLAGSQVTLVIVTFNSAHVLPDALGSVPIHTPVVIVDNASSDESVSLAREAGASVIVNRENRGFGSACNQGAAASQTPFVFFLNPDARLMPNTLSRLVAAAEKEPDVGAFGPCVLREDGSLFFRRRSFLLTKAEQRSQRLPQGDQDVLVLSGGALFCRRKAFEAVGGFDESIFLFYEDDDLCLRLRQAGWRLRHVHDALVEHKSGRSTPETEALVRFKAREMARAQAYVARKHGRSFRRGPARLRAALRLVRATVVSDRIRAAASRGRLEGLAL